MAFPAHFVDTGSPEAHPRIQGVGDRQPGAREDSHTALSGVWAWAGLKAGSCSCDGFSAGGSRDYGDPGLAAACALAGGLVKISESLGLYFFSYNVSFYKGLRNVSWSLSTDVVESQTQT